MNLQDNLDNLPTPPFIEKGRYRHYKGNEYEVLGIAFHSETVEPLVVYRTVKEKPGADFWVRPYQMFIETVVVDGKVVPRFEKITD